jgi:hypothetical protein
MDPFQFTNPHWSSKFVAIYAQHSENLNFIDFQGIAAGVSWDVYLLTIIICCLLVLLFAFIECVRPSKKWNAWDVTLAVLPCFNSQAQKKSLENKTLFVDPTLFHTNLIH